MATFKYPFFKPRDASLGPYLPIQISNPEIARTVDWYSLIDTGADTCLFSREIAEMLGHNLYGQGVKSAVSIGVEGRMVRSYLHTFSIGLLHPAKPGMIVWQSRKRLYECIGHSNCPQLLGVKEFLKFFRITIDYGRKETILHPLA